VLPTHSNGRRLIEMSALGVSKASTLAELCERHDIDAADDTPGCIAFRAGPTAHAVYELIVEAGVRAELLLARFAQLDSDDDDDDDGPVDVNPQKYLASKLDYADDKLLDQDSNGVMMAWESEIMLKSVELLLPEDDAKKRKRVLNVGFGMGIVDTAFQRRIGEDGEHYIVEAHPDVLDKMRRDGWMDRKGVTVLEGRWQQALLPLVEAGTTFDAIYFDTFAEPYSALKTFFNELVIALLEPDGGRFGFFHGLGADRRVSWDVYTRVVEIDLLDAGLQTQWTDVDIDVDADADEGVAAADEGVAADSTWAGVRRKYWDVGAVYRLPICTFLA